MSKTHHSDFPFLNPRFISRGSKKGNHGDDAEPASPPVGNTGANITPNLSVGITLDEAEIRLMLNAITTKIRSNTGHAAALGPYGKEFKRYEEWEREERLEALKIERKELERLRYRLLVLV